MLLKNLLSIVILLSVITIGQGQSGKYPIQNFTPADYQAGIQNIDFAQNRDMALFVANNLGVLSFNGDEWETHAYRTGKKQRSLAFDENTNRLYVGSQGDFGFFEDNWNYHSLVNEVPATERDFDEVWDVFSFNDKVYFCTFQNIYVYDGDNIHVIKSDEGLNRSFCIGNQLFTQNAEGALYEIKGLDLIPIPTNNEKGDIVAGIIPKDGGVLLFYNSGNVEYVHAYGADIEYVKLIDVLKGEYVNHVMQLSDNRVVIATQRSGLYLFNLNNQSIENISIEDGLLSSACLRTFQDNTGNLWVGMQNGMAVIDINSPMRLISQEINIQGSGYEVYDVDEGTYYTTSNGIYFLSKNKNQSIFLNGTEGPAYGMQMINNKLYAGHHTGLFVLENGKARRIASTDGMWQVKQLRANPEYAIGGTYSGLYLFKINNQGELDVVQKIDGFNESSRFFEEDRKGRIWVGQFYKGLYLLQFNAGMTGASVKKLSDPDLPINERIVLSKLDDELYLATVDGIYHIDQNTNEITYAEHFSSKIGKQWVHLLTQDLQKNIHVFTEHLVGFFKQISTSNYAYVPSSLFQLRHSFNNDLLHVSTHVNSGVYFNANEGFIHYNPKLEDNLNIDNEPVISHVYNVDEDSLLYMRKPFAQKMENMPVKLHFKEAKVIQFKAESFIFKGVNNRQFRYFLEGFDENYGEWTSSNIKEYTNLKSGDYQFYIQTVNALGETITSQPIMLSVYPPFYKSMTMKVVYVIISVLILLQGYRLQRQYYKGKATKLERSKKVELAKKQKELQEMKEEQIKSELRHVNNLLAASTMNLVVKNEFMENIKEELKQVKLKGEVAQTRKALERIVKEIDTTLKVQEDWKQFEYHFDRVHGDFLSRLTREFIDLTPGEQKLCAFLRLKMDTKEIANLMGISLRGVEVARYRLRKKLGLENYQNLSKFILEY